MSSLYIPSPSLVGVVGGIVVDGSWHNLLTDQHTLLPPAWSRGYRVMVNRSIQ
jgi:hypothetical protein